MNYIFLLILALFSNDPDPQYPGCINGVGHTKNRVLYSIPDTTGLNYSFDSTLNSRMGVVSIFIDTFEYLVIPSGMDTLVWNCTRCDSLLLTPSDTIRQLVRVLPQHADLTPNPVNWSSIYAYLSGCNDLLQIRKINDAIRLKITFQGDINRENYISLLISPTDNIYDAVEYRMSESGLTVDISEGMYVGFCVDISEHPNPVNLEVTVKNQSDGDVVLDTFNVIVIY